MATKPTPGASAGTWGTEMNTFLDVSLDVNGKIATEALQTDSTAPVADAAVANRKFVVSLAISVVKAWVQFDGDDGTIQGTGHNVTSVTRTDVGKYTIAFTDNLANNDYAVSGFCADGTTGAGFVCNQTSGSPESTSQMLIETWDSEAAALADFNRVHVMIIGDQV
ncbi:MAG TPA: hypothetical protein ENI05_01480 [Porticoccus sp.]|nr:hypothetical protein [Porticoccus sp.]